MSNIRCDLCGSAEYEDLYTPIGTRRDVGVCQCLKCGLLFSIAERDAPDHLPCASGDADWGNIRYSKGARLKDISDWIPKNISKVLDIGSNRGDFIDFMDNIKVTAVEPDKSVIDYYDRADVKVGYFEDVDVGNDFDFVYCCQTLEHVTSPTVFLRKVYDCMRQGGKLLLEVPNVNVMLHPLSVEEFFIDKHTFHFGKETMIRYLFKCGFVIERVNNDDLNVRILARKPDFPYMPHRVHYYSHIIENNREKLPAVVAKINEIHGRVAFWGATTIFDLLVRYGGLKDVECLVDPILYEYLPETHGVKVENVDALRVYQPEFIIILARFSADKIVEDARKYNIRNIIKFEDLLESV